MLEQSSFMHRVYQHTTRQRVSIKDKLYLSIRSYSETTQAQRRRRAAKRELDGMLVFLAGLLLCGASIVCGGVAERTDCPVISHSEVESLIGETFIVGDNPATPTINLESFHIVCLAPGITRGEYRYVSLLASYTCGGNANCPSGTAVSQFDFSCYRGVWEDTIFFNSDHIRNDDPLSDFSTAAQESCSICASQEALVGFGELTTDNATHCVGESLPMKLCLYLTEGL